jgi:hypothetical protein
MELAINELPKFYCPHFLSFTTSPLLFLQKQDSFGLSVGPLSITLIGVMTQNPTPLAPTS